MPTFAVQSAQHPMSLVLESISGAEAGSRVRITARVNGLPMSMLRSDPEPAKILGQSTAAATL